MHDFDKKTQNKPRTLDYSGIIDFLIELHQEKNFMQILNYIHVTVLAFHFKLYSKRACMYGSIQCIEI